MKKLRWQLIIIFVTGLVVGILLLGEQPNPQVLAPEPTQGGIYSEAFIGSPQRWNPVLDYYNPVDREVDALIYSGLLRFDSRGIPQPDLAESWGISKDGMVYNFALRPDLVWHDGQALTADDILFTIELLRDEEGIVPADLKVFWQDIEVRALSETTLQFQLPEPFAPFLDYLTFGVLPKHLLEGLSFAQLADSSFNLQPVGSGPYQFDKLLVEDDQIIGLVLKANETYYDERAFLDQFIIRFYQDSNEAYDAYISGTVQGIGKVTPDVLPYVLADDTISVYTSRLPEISMLMFNLNNPQKEFLQDSDVRRALMLGLNRQWIVDRILNGQAIVADGPILPGTWAYFDNIRQFAYDPETAQDMLKDAGYVIGSDEGSIIREKDGVQLSFNLSFPDDALHYSIAEAIQRDYAKLNVQVNLEPLTYEELLTNRLETRTFESALIELNFSRSPDPDPYPFWDQAQATGGQNFSQWDNRMASEYLEQARVTTDLTERAHFYGNFQVLYTEDLPALPLYSPVYSYAISQSVQGVQVGALFDSSDRFVTVSEWFLLARPVRAEANPE
jgi:peptide/nickel transport system substrate-binding protein